MFVLRDGSWVEIDFNDIRSTDMKNADYFSNEQMIFDDANMSPLITSNAIQLKPPTPEPLAPEPLSIHHAVRSGNIHFVRQCIKQNNKDILNSVEGDKRNTPLHLAVEHQQNEIFWALLNAGADIGITNKDDNYPLHKKVNHAPLALEVWKQRETLPAKDKIPDAVFFMLSHHFLFNLKDYHADLLSLLKGASSKLIDDFVRNQKIKGHSKNPLLYLTNRENEYTEIGKCLLDHADAYVLVEENAQGNCFLSSAILHGCYELINYARTCQNGVLANTVNKYLPKSVALDVFAEVQSPPQGRSLPPKQQLQLLNADLAKMMGQIQHDKDKIQQLQANIKQNINGITKIKEQIESCERALKDNEKQELLKQAAENFEKLKACQEKQTTLEAKLAALGSTSLPYRPTTAGVKRSFENVINDNVENDLNRTVDPTI